MTLVEGDFIKLTRVDSTKALYVDWINVRDAMPGDIAAVKEIFNTDSGLIVRLSCEPRSGFQEWCATFHEADLTYELLRRAAPITPAPHPPTDSAAPP